MGSKVPIADVVGCGVSGSFTGPDLCTAATAQLFDHLVGPTALGSAISSWQAVDIRTRPNSLWVVSGGLAFCRSGFLITWLRTDVDATGVFMPHLERARFLDKISQLCVTVSARIEVRREIGKTPANQSEGTQPSSSAS